MFKNPPPGTDFWNDSYAFIEDDALMDRNWLTDREPVDDARQSQHLAKPAACTVSTDGQGRNDGAVPKGRNDSPDRDAIVNSDKSTARDVVSDPSERQDRVVLKLGEMPSEYLDPRCDLLRWDGEVPEALAGFPIFSLPSTEVPMKPLLTQAPAAPKRGPDRRFLEICQDFTVTFNPRELKFVPSCLWTDSEVTFGDLVENFFHRKHSTKCRFLHKLYNALRLTEAHPHMFEYVGAAWITDSIMKVHKGAFAQLLGVKCVAGALFHLQGNFPCHGFVEVGYSDAVAIVPPAMLFGVDFEWVRLMTHPGGKFDRDISERAIEDCGRVPTALPKHF
jgi:hypothetical protein